jgi:hypothetical protein
MTLYSATDRGPSAGSVTNVCVASLPRAWEQALHNDVVPTAGSNPGPLAITNDGAVITDWTDGQGDVRFGSVKPGSTVATLGRMPTPTGSKIGTVAAAGHFAVASFYRGGRTTDIDLFDLATGRVTPLLPDAPLARHAHAFGGAWLTVQHKTVYWPASRTASGAPNVLISYDIAKRSYRRKQTDGPAVFYNPLGIYWQGGYLASQQLPPDHPPIGQRMTVATDSDALAWSSGDGSTLRWSDLEGDSRTLSQDLSHFLGIDAVAGPYVLLDRGEGDDSDAMSGNVQLLDTRTGAIADTHVQAGWYPVVSRGGLLAFATGDRGSTFHLVDTSKLPELRCD